MEKHEFNIFPEMSEDEYSELKADIKENGYDVTNPVWHYEGKVLDGWNRTRACEELGVLPVIKYFSGTDFQAIEFVMRSNKRRNLTSSQRSAMAVEADAVISKIRAEVERERRERLINNENASKTKAELIPPSFRRENKESNETRSKVAKIFNTNPKYIDQAARLKEEKPEVFRQVLRGEKTLTEVKKEEIKEKQIKKFEELKEKELSEIASDYDVIVIDPAWEMEKIERDVAPDQIGFDYPTMTIDEIKNFKLPASENCHVFMWTTQKYLPESFEIFKSWGVKYVITFVWHKNGGFQPFGLPQYNCEFVLYGRIGTPKFYDLKQFPTCFNAPRTGHSAKPEEFYEMIRRVTAGKRIDIFNRRKIEGFDTWGNEA